MTSSSRIAHFEILSILLLAASSAIAAVSAPTMPSGPPPRPTNVENANIPKTGPLLNQLYRSQFEANPVGQTGARSSSNPVSMVVELTTNATDAVATRVKTLRGSVDRVYRNLVFITLPLAQLPMLTMSEDILRIRRPYRSSPDVITEGVAMHDADLLHLQGLMGNGVKVGILDCGGFDGYAGLLGTELPAAVTLWAGGLDPVGSNIHGTACAEIVHDMAPDAELFLAYDGTEAEYYEAVDWMIAQDVDIVSYSCGWTAPVPHDGAGLPHNPINEKVAEARAAGLLWVNSAGNSAEDDNYQHAYTPRPDSDWHEFDDGWANGWGWLQTGYTYYSVLCWNDWPADPTTSGATSDYDFYLYQWDGSAWQQMTGSSNPQDGNPGELPCEEIEYSPPVDDWYYLGVWKDNADGTHFLDLRKTPKGAFLVNNPEYSIGAPAESPHAVAVGAVHWSSMDLEVFSSRGPTLGPGGTPTGGLLKPDLSAADAVSTVSYGPTDGQPFPGGEGFYGTSASCPHVAGGAALLLEADPTLDADGLEARLLASAMDLGVAGPDNEFGAGLMMLNTLEIFADGFESNNTSAWSSTSP